MVKNGSNMKSRAWVSVILWVSGEGIGNDCREEYYVWTTSVSDSMLNFRTVPDIFPGEIESSH